MLLEDWVGLIASQSDRTSHKGTQVERFWLFDDPVTKRQMLRIVRERIRSDMTDEQVTNWLPGRVMPDDPPYLLIALRKGRAVSDSDVEAFLDARGSR